MRKKEGKRLISLLLTLCFMFTMLPVTAMADSTSSFTDVSAGNWYYEVVAWAADEGIIPGETETTFAPDNNATRGDIVYALHQLIDAPEAEKVAPFLDVTSDMKCAEAVAWAAENRIVSGYGAQMFGPNDPVTREQMSAILYRFARYLLVDTSAKTSLLVFSDYANVDAYALGAMEWACAEGLFSGMGDGTLNPDGFITRAQVASILYRYHEEFLSDETIVEEKEDIAQSGIEAPKEPGNSSGSVRPSGDRRPSSSHSHVYNQYVSNGDGTHKVSCSCGDEKTEDCVLVNGTCKCEYKLDTWDGTADTSWYNDEDTVFIVNTAEQLAGLADLVEGGKSFVGKTVKLEANIDLYAKDENGEPICFDPIGSYRKDQAFDGTFDGQGHTISNLNQNTWALDNGYYYGDLGLGLFGKVENATIKNLKMDGAEISGESALCGVVSAAAYGDCTFENITVSNSNCADYQYYAGGVVGWASGNHVYKNINVEETTTLAGQWGDFNNANGGIIGGAGSSAEIIMEDCTVACRIDAFNDVTSAYQWYTYRRSGMLIGDSNHTQEVNGTTYAAAPQLKAKNVTVIYGEWADYEYCKFSAERYPWVRVQEGVSTGAYSNPRYGHPTDAMGNEVQDDNHVHSHGEPHKELIVFDQLYGGDTGDRYATYGWPTHDGVTVIYNNSKVCDSHVYEYEVAADGIHKGKCSSCDVTIQVKCADSCAICKQEKDAWTEMAKQKLAASEAIPVSTANELKAFAAMVDSGEDFSGQTIFLDADIDLSAKNEKGDPVSFDPIGDKAPFSGTFDGQGHTIANLYQSGWAFGYEWGSYGSIGLFGEVEDATIKNVTVKGFDACVEGGDIGGITGSASGNCVFENITIEDSEFGTYNNGIGGIIGWSGAGNYTFKNIKIGEDVVLGGLWGSFDSSIGGVVGQGEPGATYNFENVDIACRLDAYNDCTASYDYYNYRMCGMIIGRLEETTTIDGVNYPDTSKYDINCTNVTVTYGDWMNYHYCEPTPGLNNGRGMRVEPGYAYGGLPADFDHSQCVDNHMKCIPFDQIFGGAQLGVKGLKTYAGVTVNYPDPSSTADTIITETQTLEGDKTLKNTTIATAVGPAIKVAAGTTLNLTIEGDVKLNGATNGIQVEEGATLKLKGTEGSELVINAANGSGIGNEGGSVGTITIDGIDSLTVKVSTDAEKGKHAFGIGGAVNGPITIKNTTIEYINGGCPQEQFVSDADYGKSEPEGGAAIGVSAGAECNEIILDGVIIKEAVGGSKAAAIGAQYWAGADITITDCDLRNIVGGNASAGIGGSRVPENPSDAQNITITIDNSTITAQGGQFGAGIGSGYDTHCGSNQPMCTINISGNSVIKATGGKYAAGIGTGYHNAQLSGEIKSTVTVNAVSGDKYYKDAYTQAQDIGFGVVDPTREAKDNTCYITVDGTEIHIPEPGAGAALTTLSFEEEVIENESEEEVIEDESEEEVIEDKSEEEVTENESEEKVVEETAA